MSYCSFIVLPQFPPDFLERNPVSNKKNVSKKKKNAIAEAALEAETAVSAGTACSLAFPVRLVTTDERGKSQWHVVR